MAKNLVNIAASRAKKFFTYFLLCLLLAGCSTMKPQDFNDKPLKLVLEEYFVGKSRGVGLFFERGGNVKTSFTVDVEGSWDGKVLTLTEVLKFENGEVQNRNYRIEKIDDHTYNATTADMEGVTTIEVYGNTMKWVYDLRQTFEGRTVLLHFNDWMHLQPDGVILNRAYASKWGFGVGEVFMSLRKL